MATAASATITPPRVAMIDARTGFVTREWYMFFLSLFRTSEAIVDAESAAGLNANSQIASLEYAIEQLSQASDSQPVSVVEQIQPLLDALAMELQARTLSAIEQTRPILDDLAQQIGTARVEAPSVPTRFILPFNIAPGASPYTYQNSREYPADVVVNGGTVSAIAFSRDNATFYTIGTTSGMFALSPYDYLRVTYTVAPTMTLIPR
jgi:hypothetical protein